MLKRCEAEDSRKPLNPPGMEALACVMWTVVLLPGTAGLNATTVPANVTSMGFHITPNITDFSSARRISDPNETADTSQVSSPDTSPVPKRDEDHRAQSSIAASEIIPTIPFVSASTLKFPIPGSSTLEEIPQDGPSELDVGDEGTVPSPFPLDPLLAGLISIFIISTALLSTMLFLRFRQQSRHPEFHRLHDLPMDDLIEDTPLSR